MTEASAVFTIITNFFFASPFFGHQIETDWREDSHFYIMISSQKISSTMLSQQSSLSPATSGSNLSSKVDHFTRWRPGFHLIAPKNWMNDPCGPCFDPSTGLFNVLYQCECSAYLEVKSRSLFFLLQQTIHMEQRGVI